MKNILLISSEFPPLPGGIGNHALHLASSLHKEGKSVTVLTNQRSSKHNEDVDFDSQLPFNVQRIKRQKILLVTYIDRIFRALQFIGKNRNVTVICSGKFSVWTGGIASILLPANVYIAVLHGSEINAGGRISMSITKHCLRIFDTIVAVSSFTKKLALKENPKLHIVVINNGFYINSHDLKSNGGIKGNPAIVSVGNVTFRKGQHNVIKSLPLLKQKFPEIHYHIIGIPTEQNAFLEIAQLLDVTENITFHGVLGTNELQHVVSNSKVFFMLSDTLKNGDVEGFGIAILEANYFGLPAIGSKNSGIVDAIHDGFSGKLVNQLQPKEIEAAFQEIIANYKHFSTESKRWSENFTWEIIIKKYLEIID